MTTITLADEIRENTRRIVERYHDTFEAIAPIRVTHLKVVMEHIDRLETRVAGCTCTTELAYEIPVARCETPSYAALRNASIARMKHGDA